MFKSPVTIVIVVVSAAYIWINFNAKERAVALARRDEAWRVRAIAIRLFERETFATRPDTNGNPMEWPTAAQVDAAVRFSSAMADEIQKEYRVK